MLNDEVLISKFFNKDTVDKDYYEMRVKELENEVNTLREVVKNSNSYNSYNNFNTKVHERPVIIKNDSNINSFTVVKGVVLANFLWFFIKQIPKIFLIVILVYLFI